MKNKSFRRNLNNNKNLTHQLIQQFKYFIVI